MNRRESSEILFEIKKDYPRFEKDEFIEGAKIDIKNLYYAFCKNEWELNKVNCTNELKNKIKNNSDSYRINKNYDTVSIQYIELCDYIQEKENTIKLYVSAIFYDDVDNNEIKENDNSDKYFNDVWVVSYKDSGQQADLKCNNCGATMEKDENNNLLKCSYCRTQEYYNFKVTNWKIYDIEIVK